MCTAGNCCTFVLLPTVLLPRSPCTKSTRMTRTRRRRKRRSGRGTSDPSYGPRSATQSWSTSRTCSLSEFFTITTRHQYMIETNACYVQQANHVTFLPVEVSQSVQTERDIYRLYIPRFFHAHSQSHPQPPPSFVSPIPAASLLPCTPMECNTPPRTMGPSGGSTHSQDRLLLPATALFTSGLRERPLAQPGTTRAISGGKEDATMIVIARHACSCEIGSCRQGQKGKGSFCSGRCRVYIVSAVREFG